MTREGGLCVLHHWCLVHKVSPSYWTVFLRCQTFNLKIKTIITIFLLRFTFPQHKFKKCTIELFPCWVLGVRFQPWQVFAACRPLILSPLSCHFSSCPVNKGVKKSLRNIYLMGISNGKLKSRSLFYLHMLLFLFVFMLLLILIDFNIGLVVGQWWSSYTVMYKLEELFLYLLLFRLFSDFPYLSCPVKPCISRFGL